MFLVGLILSLVGIFAGFMAGLLGIGGGLVIVPALYLVFSYYGVAPEQAMLGAIGTSLAIMVPTAIVSSYVHWRKGTLAFDLIKKWAILIVLGVIFGGYIAVEIAGKVLMLLYLVYLVVIASLFFYKANFQSEESQKNKWLHIFEMPIICMVGVLSALFGIGGGTFTVPFMTGLGISLKKSISTASFIGLMIGGIGALNYMSIGREVVYAPVFLSVGYVSMASFCVIVPTAMVAAYWGGRMVHVFPERITQNVFAALLLVMGLKILYTLM